MRDFLRCLAIAAMDKMFCKVRECLPLLILRQARAKRHFEMMADVWGDRGMAVIIVTGFWRGKIGGKFVNLLLSYKDFPLSGSLFLVIFLIKILY